MLDRDMPAKTWKSWQGLPPQNLEAERGVLASIIIDPAVWPEVSAILLVEDFYRDTHQIIYREVSTLAARNQPIDFLTTLERLTVAGQLEKVGGIDAIREIMDSIPHTANAVYYAQIVSENAGKRAVIEAGAQMIREAQGSELNLEELTEAAERRIFAINLRQRKHKITMLPKAVREAVERIDQRSTGTQVGLQTGFDDLDCLLGGLEGPQLVVLAGRPSMGKTAAAMNIAENLATAGMPVFVASLEQASKELAERMISGTSRIDGYKFKGRPRLSEDEWHRLNWAKDQLQTLPIGICDDPYQTASTICSGARQFHRKHGKCVVIVDHLSLVEVAKSDRKQNRSEEVGKIAWAFKSLAKELGQPVLVLSQLNRKVEDREDKTPRLSDLRESGEIEQNADVVILVHRPEYYDANDSPGVAKFIVAKNRNGSVGTATVAFIRHLTRFEGLLPAGITDGGEF